jgi:hypothetical protein
MNQAMPDETPRIHNANPHCGSVSIIKRAIELDLRIFKEIILNKHIHAYRNDEKILWLEIEHELFTINFKGFENDPELTEFELFFNLRKYTYDKLQFQLYIYDKLEYPCILYGYVKILNQELSVVPKSYFNEIPNELFIELIKYLDKLDLTVLLKYFPVSELIFKNLLYQIPNINFKILHIINQEYNFNWRELYTTYINFNGNLLNSVILKYKCYEKNSEVYISIIESYPKIIYTDPNWSKILMGFEDLPNTDELLSTLSDLKCDLDMYKICDTLFQVDQFEKLQLDYYIYYEPGDRIDKNMTKIIKWSYNNLFINLDQFLRLTTYNPGLLRWCFGESDNIDTYKIKEKIVTTHDFYLHLNMCFLFRKTTLNPENYYYIKSNEVTHYLKRYDSNWNNFTTSLLESIGDSW